MSSPSPEEALARAPLPALQAVQLVFFSLWSQELQHKLALVHSIQKVIRAIQAVDTEQSFRLCKKPEVLKVLLVSAWSWGCPQGRQLFPEVSSGHPPAPCPQLLGPGALALAGSVVAVGMKGLVRAPPCPCPP